MQNSNAYNELFQRYFLKAIEEKNSFLIKKIIDKQKKSSNRLIDNDTIFYCIKNYEITDRCLSDVLKIVDINIENSDGENLLFQASKSKNVKNVKVLIKNGADFEMPDQKGNMIAHLLSKDNSKASKKILKILFKNGARNLQDSDCNTPLDYVYSSGEYKFGFEIENILFNNNKSELTDFDVFQDQKSSDVCIDDYEFVDYYRSDAYSNSKRYYFQELSNDLKQKYLNKFKQRRFEEAKNQEIEL